MKQKQTRTLEQARQLVQHYGLENHPWPGHTSAETFAHFLYDKGA